MKTDTWRGAPCNVRLDVLDQGTAAPYPYRFELDAWRTVPEPVRQRVVQASLMGLQWNTLRLLARCPAAQALAERASSASSPSKKRHRTKNIKSEARLGECPAAIARARSHVQQ